MLQLTANDRWLFVSTAYLIQIYTIFRIVVYGMKVWRKGRKQHALIPVVDVCTAPDSTDSPDLIVVESQLSDEGVRRLTLTDGKRTFYLSLK